MFGERLDGGLGRVVCRVAGWVGDALLGAGDDDGGGRGLRAEARDEGVEAVDDAEEVGLEDLRLFLSTGCLRL